MKTRSKGKHSRAKKKKRLDSGALEELKRLNGQLKQVVGSLSSITSHR